MIAWLRRRVRRWRRGRAAALCGASLPASTGHVAVAVLDPAGTIESPVFLTVLRKERVGALAGDGCGCSCGGAARGGGTTVAGAGAEGSQGLHGGGVDDVEIRGFLDGEVKFERNVATQYHVRIGCEGSKPVGGRYEVMRLLLRWDLSSIPREAKVGRASLVLCQEDTSRFPHRHPPRWPVDFYLYEVRRPWGAGRGGVDGDNQSRPERGDAWWAEARAGEAPWREPGCGQASDSDPDADRGAEPVAWARLRSPAEELRFSGERLARRLGSAASRGGALDLIVKASAADEALPGSVKTFFSSEFGDDLNPSLRPRLEVEWTAPCSWAEVRPFVLEPGTEVLFRPALDAGRGGTLAASVRSDPGGAIVPEATAEGWIAEGEPGPRSHPLSRPVKGAAPGGLAIRLGATPNALRAGESLSIRILETWHPDCRRPEDLDVRFRFTSPSSRTVEARALHVGAHVHSAEFAPDELGIWRYEWWARPDRRFETQRGGGLFTVILGTGESRLEDLRWLADAAIREASSCSGLAARRRAHYRLVQLQREVRSAIAQEGAEAGRSEGLREVLGRIAAALPGVD